MTNIARWTMRHRRIVVTAWIAAAIGVFAVSNAVGKKTASSFTLPGTNSQQAVDLLMGAPSEATPKQLRELHIRTNLPNK